MQLTTVISKVLQADKIKTIFYTFSLLAAHAIVPQTAIAQETPSTEEVVVGYGTWFLPKAKNGFIWVYPS